MRHGRRHQGHRAADRIRTPRPGPPQPQAATFGFALNPSTWGNGYGTETVRLLLACAFEDLGLHRVWGARSPHNHASARTMERAGLTEEGSTSASTSNAPASGGTR
ncbi:GNAT family N-acetyltransferase [Streptomyces californicus]|uniref:GNAT family N-acetyltransferase n=1 Tax=Streptomyces californicus TaxID=67351 RepID=UPI00340A7204